VPVASIPNALIPFINAADKAAQPISLSPELTFINICWNSLALRFKISFTRSIVSLITFSLVTSVIVTGKPRTLLIFLENSSALLLSELKHIKTNLCIGKLLIPNAIPSWPSEPNVAI
jgi:hypothetical protein